MNCVPAAVLLALVPVAAWAQRMPVPPSPKAPPTPESTAIPNPSRANVVYGEVDGHKLHLDVYEPRKQTSSAPGIIVIHGGGWTEFDKSIMDGTAAKLARAGFVAFSVDYRLLKYREHPPRNQWPAQLEDCQRAVRWVRRHAQEYHVDPSQIGSFGHSAGGQLAALLGMTDASDPTEPGVSSQVQAVVDVSGVSDFTGYQGADGDGLFAALFGGTEEQVPAVWRAASPVFRVQTDDPPFLLVHGTWDRDVPLRQSQELARALKNAGVDVTLVTVDDAHTFQTDAAKRRLMDETVAFFTRTLRQ
jgi:acetyl esterase/lipase